VVDGLHLCVLSHDAEAVGAYDKLARLTHSSYLFFLLFTSEYCQVVLDEALLKLDNSCRSVLVKQGYLLSF